MKTRNRKPQIGQLSKSSYYTAGGLKRRGFGPDRLKEMRASGIVTPINVGNARWYRGAEVCRWLDSLAK